jgi:hypothetical protein
MSSITCPLKQKIALKKTRQKPTTFFNPETDPDRKPTFEQKTDPDRCQKVNPAGVLFLDWGEIKCCAK